MRRACVVASRGNDVSFEDISFLTCPKWDRKVMQWKLQQMHKVGLEETRDTKRQVQGERKAKTKPVLGVATNVVRQQLMVPE